MAASRPTRPRTKPQFASASGALKDRDTARAIGNIEDWITQFAIDTIHDAVLLESQLVIADVVRIGSATGPLITSGSGTPEGVVSAPVGSLYTDTDGGASTTLYVKESGAAKTGWIAK